MKDFILRLPLWVELAVVELGAFGYFIATSLWFGTHPVMAPRDSNSRFLDLALFEITVFAVLWGFLHLRGWSFSRMGLSLDALDALKGFGLAIVALVAYQSLGLVAAMIAPQWLEHAVITANFPKPGLSIPTAVAVSLVNPIYEEVFVAGYLISALKGKRSNWFAINLSLAIRLLYHLYQGPIAIFAILPVGLIFGWWYVRTGKLLPLIAGHGLLDLLSLAALTR